MARPNERGLELTFHKPTKRWRKRIDGQNHWFGPGKGVSDRASYRKALKRYRAFMDRREQAIEAAARGVEIKEASPLGEGIRRFHRGQPFLANASSAKPALATVRVRSRKADRDPVPERSAV